MDTRMDTIAAAGAAMPDFKEAFDGLEDPIMVLVRRVKAVDWIIGNLIDYPTDEFGFRRISDGPMDALASMVWDAESAAKKLEDHWIEVHNARCAVEQKAYRAERAAR